MSVCRGMSLSVLMSTLLGSLLAILEDKPDRALRLMESVDTGNNRRHGCISRGITHGLAMHSALFDAWNMRLGMDSFARR